jgi:hypothetical protein
MELWVARELCQSGAVDAIEMRRAGLLDCGRGWVLTVRICDAVHYIERQRGGVRVWASADRALRCARDELGAESVLVVW